MKKIFLLLFTGLQLFSNAQNLKSGNWSGALHRQDGKIIPFQFTIEQIKGKLALTIINDVEKIKITEVRLKGDSLFFHMPVFESYFETHIVDPRHLEGVWIKGTSLANQEVKFTADFQEKNNISQSNHSTILTGKWKVTFTSNAGEEQAIAVLKQNGNYLKGSVVSPSGDDRYLYGSVKNDSFSLSTFDGVHAFLFKGRYSKSSFTGEYYSGAKAHQHFDAVKNDTATLPDLSAMYLKNGENEVMQNFHFKDLNGKMISLSDPKFNNKVIIIQIMGSWCPNCMDEMAYLSEWYKKNKVRGVEIIGLAYEYSTNYERSKKSLQRFQQRFKVDYPLLITGVTSADPEKTEKTLPQFTPIKTFPTTIILDKNKRVKKISTDFSGPATGIYYTNYITDFERTINELLVGKS